jgi:hypothetical protein
LKSLRSLITRQNYLSHGFSDTLKPTGTVKIILPNSDSSNGDIYIKGTNYKKPITDTIIYLENLPSGFIPEIIYSPNSGNNQTIIDSLKVSSNDTTTVTTVLYITRNDSDKADSNATFMSKKLREYGLRVKIIDDRDVELSDTAGVTAIIISSSATLPNNPTMFKNIPIPVLVINGAFTFSMGLTDSVYNEDFGRSALLNNYNVNMGPLSGGLESIVPILTKNMAFRWGKNSSSGHVVATLPYDTTRASIFYYKTGDTMVNAIAPSKRGAFLFEPSCPYFFTKEAWLLFRNMVQWIVD